VKPIAAAATTSDPAIVIRRYNQKEFERLNQRGVFIYWKSELSEPLKLHDLTEKGQQ
jgi:hypothetical protein